MKTAWPAGKRSTGLLQNTGQETSILLSHPLPGSKKTVSLVRAKTALHPRINQNVRLQHLAELEEPPSSDSLDTLIGLSTETGRTTAITPASLSEGLAASSDAAAASSDLSRPETPCQEGNNMATQAASPYQGHLAATARSSPPRLAGQQRSTTQEKHQLPAAEPRPLTRQWTSW